MAQQLNLKARALLKDEIVMLLDLIAKHPVLTSKSTNATNNKLKEEAWKVIAQEFSAVTGDSRRPEQLRSKWENLKKAARKRSAIIRENNLKTGGGKSFIPPDDILDRVASVLGATCTGYTVEFGGDGVSYTVEIPAPEAVVEVLDFHPLPELPELVQGDGIMVVGGERECVGGGEINKIITPTKLTFNTPKSAFNKRRKLSEEVQRAQRDKDLALAAYFQAKAEKVRLENTKLELEIRQLKQKLNED